jgi:hypothetical protein
VLPESERARFSAPEESWSPWALARPVCPACQRVKLASGLKARHTQTRVIIVCQQLNSLPYGLLTDTTPGCAESGTPCEILFHCFSSIQSFPLYSLRESDEDRLRHGFKYGPNNRARGTEKDFASELPTMPTTKDTLRQNKPVFALSKI